MSAIARAKWLGAVVALQMVWVIATSWHQERQLVRGELVLLETAPVDPRDLLRGDYVILNYVISTIPKDRFDPPLPPANEPEAGTPVHVELTQVGDFHQISRASLEPISPAPGNVVLVGRIQRPRFRNPNFDSVRAEYDLERYYVREGTGNPTGKVTVRVAVPPGGQGLIREVLVDGVPYGEAMRAQGR